MEGYPCSANTYLYVYLKRAKPELKLAHHTHSVGNLKLALHWRIPAVVVIRYPPDAIASRLVRFGADLNESIREYIDFYGYVVRNRTRLIVLQFEEIVGSPLEAVQVVNTQTHLKFRVKDPTAHHKEVLSEIRRWTRQYDDPSRISLPETTRNRSKAKLMHLVKNHPETEEALALFEQLVSATSPPKGKTR